MNIIKAGRGNCKTGAGFPLPLLPLQGKKRRREDLPPAAMCKILSFRRGRQADVGIRSPVKMSVNMQFSGNTDCHASVRTGSQ